MADVGMLHRTPLFKVELGLAANPLDALASVAWTDVTPYARSFFIARGRQHELNRFEAGKASVTLDNLDRRFDPEFAASPYAPNIKPMRRLRISSLLYATEVVKDGATNYWRLNETSGNFADMIGTLTQVAAGTIARNVTGAIIDSDGAADFDGSTGRASVAGGASTPFFSVPASTGQGFTLECWLKNDGLAGTDCALHLGSLTPNRGVRLDATGANYRVAVVVGGSFTATVAAPASFGVYRHLVATVKKSGTSLIVTLFIDGAQVAQSTHLTTTYVAADAGDPISVAAQNNAGTPDNFWNGPIDDVSIYPTVLTDAQILNHYNLGVTSGVARLFTGYIEGWPPKFDQGAFDATVEVEAADAFKVFNLWRFLGRYSEEVLFDNPLGYYRLGESAPAANAIQTATDSSGFGRHGAYANENTISGASPITYGDPALIVGDDDTCPRFNGTAPSSSRVRVTDPAAQILGTGAFTLEAWVKKSTGGSSGTIIAQASNLFTGGGSSFAARGYHLRLSTSAPRFIVWNEDGTTSIDLTSPDALANDTTYHVVAVRKSDGSSELWVDNVLKASAGVATATSIATGKLWFGSIIDSNVGDNNPFHGNIDEVAVYGTALSSTRIGKHYTAGVQGWSELTSARITRVLDLLGWPSADRSIDTGKSLMNATSDLSGKKVLEAIQQAVTAESGACYVRGDGVVEFKSRHAQINQDPLATFGDRVGEFKYIDLTFAYDDSEIWTEVRTQRVGGPVQVARDDAAVAEYGDRVLSLEALEIASDLEALDAANYNLSRYKQPYLRLREVAFNARQGYNSGDTEGPMWSALLRREVFKEMIRIKRRPPGTTNEGTQTITQDCFISRVMHRYSKEQGWETRWMLQPADQADYWVLDDTTLSVLGTTTRLAY